MNAPALNPTSSPAAGQTGAAASAAPSGQAGSPLAGFEALLAALFPQGAAAGPTPVAAKPDAVKATEEGGKEEIPAPVDSIDPEAGLLSSDPNAALLGAGVAGTPIIATSLPAPVETSPTDAAAWGRNKARGVPAAPALANANPRAGLTETAGPEIEAPSGEPLVGAPDAEPQPLHKAGPTAPAVTAQNTQSLNQPATSPARQAAAEPPAVEVTPQPVPAPETAQADAATATASPPVVAALASRPEPTPAPPPRNAKAERTKGPSDAKGSSDVRPADAVGKPVLASAPEGVAKTVLAGLEAEAPKTDEPAIAADTPDGALQAETRTTAQSLTPTAHAAHAVRGSPETVANLAAQIIKKLEGQSTRFDLELNPGGLGKVDVRVDIGAQGQITAAMTFDNPQAAADLRARASELQRLLEQAGFNLSGGVSFDVAGDRGQQQRQAWQDQTDPNGQAFRGQAFRAALDTAGDAADAAVQGALRLRRGVSAGLDLRI